ncbi:MAG TPA: transglycosylase SLT domain-containing protein [Dyella sp.]|nr:transglycosylase SLT domain-containing protein [Dyella sp.]
MNGFVDLGGVLDTLPSWQAKLSIDASGILPAMKEQARIYRTPLVAGIGLVAGTAAVMMSVHLWRANPTPVSSPTVKVTAPLVASAPVQPVASTTTIHPVVRKGAPVPAHVASTPLPKTTLGLADDGTIVVVAPARGNYAPGFDLDITSRSSLWAKAGTRYRIDPLLIYAVALVETRGLQPDGSVAPSPWIVRINGRLHSGTRAETEHAIELAHLLAVPVQDVGIMQVYYPMHRDIEPDPIALLNPARNIEIGTQLLRKAMNESSDPVLRIGYYHSHDATLARGYGQQVLDVYHELKTATGRSSSSAVAWAPKTATAHDGS